VPGLTKKPQQQKATTTTTATTPTTSTTTTATTATPYCLYYQANMLWFLFSFVDQIMGLTDMNVFSSFVAEGSQVSWRKPRRKCLGLGVLEDDGFFTHGLEDGFGWIQ